MELLWEHVQESKTVLFIIAKNWDYPNVYQQKNTQTLFYYIV